MNGGQIHPTSLTKAIVVHNSLYISDISGIPQLLCPFTDLYLSTLLLLNFYISTSQIKHSHYILGIIISISHFFFHCVTTRTTSSSSPKIFVRSTTNFGSLAFEIATEGLFYSIFLFLMLNCVFCCPFDQEFISVNMNLRLKKLTDLVSSLNCYIFQSNDTTFYSHGRLQLIILLSFASQLQHLLVTPTI